MATPAELKYSKSHEWVRREADGTVSVGITDHAQTLLGDLVFVENPEVGRALGVDEECGVVESVKAASDIYSPIAGTVVAVNGELADAPQKINEDPYGTWMFRLKPADPAQIDALLDAAAYDAHAVSES